MLMIIESGSNQSSLDYVRLTNTRDAEQSGKNCLHAPAELA